MKLGIALAAVAALVSVGAAASVLSVDGRAGPWDPTIAGNFDYGVHDNIGPVSFSVNPGDNITITYLSGMTSAFGGTPDVGPDGYIGGFFGTGLGESQTGSSGTFFPSYVFTGDLGDPVYLNALIGDFVDASGVVLSAFAPSFGPYLITAPAGAVALQFGLNDDIFGDNTGALELNVTGSSSRGVPEPAAWAMLITGFGMIGASLRMRRVRVV
jgi:hypothetical protein